MTRPSTPARRSMEASTPGASAAQPPQGRPPARSEPGPARHSEEASSRTRARSQEQSPGARSAKEKTGEADRPEQDAFVKALVSIFETSARRAAAELARPRLGNLTAAGRYAEARRKARLKRDRDARDLPYGPSLAEYEREALIDAIEKAYADGCAAAKETP